MKYKKVLLINPPYTGSRVRVVFCAGLGYIAESLEDAGICYDVFDMSLGYTYRELKSKIEEFKPELIGFSILTYKYSETYGLINRIKKDYPEVDILAGGAHVSLFREEALTECAGIDYGIVLEGEEAIVKLCKGENTQAIKGLLCRKENKIIYTGNRDFVENLDERSFPKYKKFELKRSINKEINALPIVSSRGCPYGCIYCPVKSAIGQVFRARSPKSILLEIEYWYEKGYKRFSFADDNFTLLKDRIYELCDLIEKSSLSGLKLSCDNGVRADSLDKDMLKRMKEVGFYRIAVGVEAGNNRILKNLNKSENIETITATIENACSLGYEVDLFFLVGAPGEKWEDLEDSVKIALDYPIGVAYFYNIIPFPNTPLFEWIKENGKFIKKTGRIS